MTECVTPVPLPRLAWTPTPVENRVIWRAELGGFNLEVVRPWDCHEMRAAAFCGGDLMVDSPGPADKPLTSLHDAEAWLVQFLLDYCMSTARRHAALAARVRTEYAAARRTGDKL